MSPKKPAKPAGSSPKPPAVPDWFDQEPRAGATIVKLGRRLFQRGRASWRIWGLVALVGSAGWAVLKARGGNLFEGTVVLRVSEGSERKVSKPGAMLVQGKLRAYIHDVALTSPSLVKLMLGHPTWYPKASSDPAFAVKSFRENLTIDISANDFVEERDVDDPPRTARVIINYKGADPELALQVAQELAALVIGSTMAGQRATLEADLAGARAEATRAAEAVTALEGQAGIGPNTQLQVARQRLLTTQQRVEDASVALRALGQQQVLRFEIADRGRPQPRPNPVRVGIKTFLVTSVLALLAVWLLAGAFDPRVLDEADVAATGLPVLGRLPRLTSPPPDPGSDREEQPERRSIPSGAADPRV
jgi:hypothetical protein